MIYIFVIAVIISGVLFRKACGSISLTKINMMSWIFWYELIAGSAIASILIVYNMDHHYLIDKISNDSVRFYGFCAVMYTIITFPVGMVLSNILFEKKVSMGKGYDNYLSKTISEGNTYDVKKIKLSLKIFSLISIISVVYVLCVLGTIPLFGLLHPSSAVDLLEFRIQVVREFQGNEYIKNIPALMFTPILSYISYAYYKFTHKKNDLIWAVIMSIFSILIITYDYSKSPIIMYLLGFLFLKIYIDGEVKKKTFIRFCLLGFVLIILAYIATKGYFNDLTFNEIGIIIDNIIGRVFLTQAAGTYLSFDIFPIHGEFLGFSTISQFISDFFNIPYSERMARIIMETVNPSGVMMGRAGVVNSLFIAEAWANWGLLGVLLSPIYVGFLVQTLYLFFLKSPKSPLMLGLFAYLSSRGSITGGFNDYIYNVGMLILLIFLVFISLLSYKKS